MMKKISSLIKIAIVGSSLAFLFAGCTSKESDKKEKTGVAVNSVEEFKQAILSGTKSILVSDLDFNHESISINSDVTINSIGSQSNLKNVYFNIVGPTVIGEKINISFSNLVFDDSFDSSWGN